MRKLHVLFLLLIVPMLVFGGDGTWTTNAVESYSGYNMKITFACTVDSVDTLTSNAFRLSKYDHVSWTTFPFTLYSDLGSTLGSPKCTLYIQGYDPVSAAWATIDTVFTDRTAETGLISEVDFNNKKREYYRLLLYGVALNRSDTEFDAQLLMYQEGY